MKVYKVKVSDDGWIRVPAAIANRVWGNTHCGQYGQAICLAKDKIDPQGRYVLRYYAEVNSDKLAYDRIADIEVKKWTTGVNVKIAAVRAHLGGKEVKLEEAANGVFIWTDENDQDNTHTPSISEVLAANECEPVLAEAEPLPTAVIDRYEVPEDFTYYPRHSAGGHTDIDILKTSFSRGTINVLLKGPTGSGKTSAVKKAAALMGLPYTCVNGNQQITVEDLVGHWSQREDGRFEFVEGPLTNMMRNGGVFVFEELNAAQPEIMFILHRVLDDNREVILTQNGNEVVRAHANFHFCATMNPNYEGTVILNAALKDRFALELTYPYNEEVEDKIMAELDPSDEQKGWIKKVFRTIREQKAEGEVFTELSTRKMKQLLMNIKIFGIGAAVQFFLNSFDERDRESVKYILEDTLGYEVEA